MVIACPLPLSLYLLSTNCSHCVFSRPVFSWVRATRPLSLRQRSLPPCPSTPRRRTRPSLCRALPRVLRNPLFPLSAKNPNDSRSHGDVRSEADGGVPEDLPEHPEGQVPQIRHLQDRRRTDLPGQGGRFEIAAKSGGKEPLKSSVH